MFNLKIVRGGSFMPMPVLEQVLSDNGTNLRDLVANSASKQTALKAAAEVKIKEAVAEMQAAQRKMAQNTEIAERADEVLATLEPFLAPAKPAAK